MSRVGIQERVLSSATRIKRISGQVTKPWKIFAGGGAANKNGSEGLGG
jgi:hypothetical protein